MDNPGPSTPLRHPRQVFYGWYIVLAGAINNFLVIGVIIYGFGVFIRPMTQELGWSVALIATGASIRTFETGALGAPTGYLIDKFGPRRVAMTGVALIAVGLFLFAMVRDLWLFYLSSIVIAAGMDLGGIPPFTASVMNWFSRYRGRAMGFLNAGNGLGSFAVPALTFLVLIFDWRTALWITGVVFLVVGLPMTFMLKTRPQEYGYLPDGERMSPEEMAAASTGGRSQRVDPGPQAGLSVREALGTPAFYLLALGSMSSIGTQIAWLTLQVPHLETVGFSTAAVASIVGFYGATQIVLRITAGWTGDYIGRRRMLIGCYILQGIGMFFAANLTPDRFWMVPLFYLFFATGHATWVIASQTAIADYFGVRRFATLRGLAQGLTIPIGVATPIIAGWYFDTTGSYQFIFSVYALLAASGTIWILLIRRPLWSQIAPQRAAGEAP